MSGSEYTTSGFLAIKVNNNHMKTIEKRVVAISSKLVAEQKKKAPETACFRCF